MSLTLSAVSYTYSAGESLAQVALERVSFEVSPGEFVLVAGATGSGKSTLLRLASGLLSPGAGEITLRGERLTPAAARGTVGMVFQNPEAQLFADTVLDDVGFGPRNLGKSVSEAAAVAREALETVGLDPEVLGQRSPFSLSGGQARRVAIAGVIAMHPRYLLLDEPSAGLDAAGRTHLHSILSRVRESSGVVVVSHDLDEMLPLCDRVLVLDGGRSAFWGETAELLERPELLTTSGLAMPSVLETQVLAREAGLQLDRITLDVGEAASSLLAAARHASGGSPA